jgi:hypothetical protein
MIKEKGEVRFRSELRAQMDWYRREEYIEEQERKKLAQEKEEEEIQATPARLPRKHPGMWIIYFSLFSMVVFAVGQRLLPEDDWELYIKTFTCLIANLVCALILLALVTLSALRFSCWEKKAVIPGGLGPFWSMIAAILILTVLSLASVPPRPVPEYMTQSISEDYESMVMWEDEESGKRSRSLETWGGQSKIIAAKIEKEQRDKGRVIEELKDKVSGENGEAGEEKERGGTAGGDEEDKGEASADRSSRKQGDSAGKETSSRGSRQTRSRKGRHVAAQPRRAPLPTPPLQGLEMIGKVIVAIILIIGFLWAAAMLFVALGKANPLKRLSATVKNFFGGLRGLLKRKEKPLISGQKLRATLEQRNLYMENPFSSRMLLKQMSMTELVSYTYKAFENYAHVQGHTPFRGQTPIEFMNSLPEEFKAPEFSTLLKLYMLAEYSAHKIPGENAEKLKQVWAKMEV